MGKSTTIDINERWLEAYELAPGLIREKHWDTKLTGLGVVIGRRRVSFVVQHRVGGEQRYATLGHWAPGKLRALDAGLRDRTLTVLQARGKAIEFLGQMRGGGDPRGELAPQAKPLSPALPDAMRLHLSLMRKRGASPRGMSTLEDETTRYLLSAWGERMLHEITRTDCRELHDVITTDRGPYVANRVMRHMRAIWNTALKEVDLPANPTVAVHWNTEERRQEPIPWERLPTWRAAIEGLSEVRRDYNLVVLFTGLRRMDAATIRREHVDVKERTLFRPSPKGGKRRAFTIPLSRACVEVLARRLKNNYRINGVDDGGWVFPADSLKDRDCVQCQALGLPNHKAGTRTHLMEAKERDYVDGEYVPNETLVSPHRLRDTYTTALAALDPKVSSYVIDVLTNHAPPSGTVTAGYIDLDTEDLRSAQERVAKFLLEKMSPKKRAHRSRGAASG